MQSSEMQYFKLFRDICKAMSSTLNLKEVLELITEETVRLLGVKACSIFLVDTVYQRLRIGSAYGLSKAYLNKGPIDAEKSIKETLLGRSVLVTDATSDERIQYPKEAEYEGIASILSVPIPVKEKVIGVFRIYTAQSRLFSADEIDFICAIAEMGGIAIENSRMHDRLKSDYETLMNDVHQWFEYGRMPAT
jgi:GAF domain-containing protein